MREAESRINWASHVDFVYDLIRGCNPAPGAWTTHGRAASSICSTRRKIIAPTFGAVRGRRSARSSRSARLACGSSPRAASSRCRGCASTMAPRSQRPTLGSPRGRCSATKPAGNRRNGRAVADPQRHGKRCAEGGARPHSRFWRGRAPPGLGQRARANSSRPPISRPSAPSRPS